MTSLRLDVTDASQVGEARRLVISLAEQLGFNEIDQGKAAIVASEAAANLARYAEKGELLLRTLEGEGLRGIELLAVDKGPGMQDVSWLLQDGISTSGSAGIGLGAIARQSDVFDVFSLPARGTILLARLAPPDYQTQPIIQDCGVEIAELGVICLPATGQAVCGDAWAIDRQAGRSRLMVVDGLGHGAAAAMAAKAAQRFFLGNPGLSPAACLEGAHAILHDTRGAVMAVAEIDASQHVIRYCGVGNISAALYSGYEWHGLVSYEGILGYTAHKFREFVYPYQAETRPMLILHSDGLSSHWDLNAYPGMIERHPSLMAGILYRDFKHTNDDLTVIAARLQ